jgi:phosphohistidine swiveling domain-containing protein
MEDTVFIRLEEASALNDPDRNTILLETGGLLVAEKETQRFVYDNIVLNGTPPLQTQYFLVLNGTDSDSSDAGDNIIMENSHATDVARLTTETSVASSAAEDVRDKSDLIIIDDETNDSTLQLSQLADFQFQDILRKEKVILEQLSSIRPIDYTSNLMLEGEVGGDVPIRLESGTLDDSNITTDSISLEDFTASDGKYMNGSSSNGESSNANAVEAEGIMLEDFGQLQLNGTDSDSSNAGNHILQETDKRNKFDLESNGAIIAEDYSTDSRLELISLESGTGVVTGRDNIILEDAVTRDEKIVDGIELEEGTGQNQGDNIILNGTDSDSSNAGFKLKTELQLEVDELKVNPRYMALETTDIITSVGTIPLGNWTLNSISQGYQPVVPSAIITLTDAGDIALEDATDNSGGFLVLNSTSGSSTNAGSMFDLEKGTLNDVLLNSV